MTGPVPPPWTRRRFVGAGAMLLATLVLPAGATPLAADLSKSRLEAVYLYKFAGFVSWPATAFKAPDSPIVIGVYNDAELAHELEHVAEGKRIDGRPLQVRVIAADDRAEGLHVLFLGAQSRAQATALLGFVAGRPVLTVSDDPAVYARGTMVNFVVVEDRVRFDVALGPVRRSNLHVSALMLTAARDVVRSSR